MRKWLAIIPLVAILGITGCTGGGDGGTTVAPAKVYTTAELARDIEDLSGRVIALQSAGYLKQSDLTQIKTEITALKTKVDSIQVPAAGITSAQVNALLDPLRTEINALQAGLAALVEPPPSTTVTPQAKIEAQLQFLFPSLKFTATFPGAQTGQFRLDITNTSASTLKDVQLNIFIVPSDLALTYTQAGLTTSGVGGIAWMFGGVTSGSLMFANGLGLTLAPNETKSMMMTLTLNSTGTGTVSYTPYVFVQ